jgi:uncharacterized membrane protein
MLPAKQIKRTIRMMVLPTLISVGMILGRFAYVATLRFRFCGLLLNLLLAWIPLIVALLIWRTSRSKRLALACLFVAWLLFFPNAFYITTDLVHTHKFGTDGVSRWYDILMTACFAASGVFLGSISLYLLHSMVRARFGRGAGWVFAGAVLALGSFGVYLGRFLRFNSWDVVARPDALADGIMRLFRSNQITEVASFCGGFFLFSVVVYGFIYSAAHLREQPGW